MRTLSKVVAGLAATMLMAFAVGSAAAGRFSLNTRQIRAVWRNVEFAENGLGTSIACALTLEGSFHSSTSAKVEDALVGYVSRAVLGSPCTNGTSSLLTETLPWHIIYAGFTGTLPGITSVSLEVIGASIRGVRTTFPSFDCLARSTAAQPLFWSLRREAGGNYPTVEMLPTTEIRCMVAGNIRYHNTADLMRLGTSTRDVRVTLI